jgi:undecaprenyl-diphosphatase
MKSWWSQRAATLQAGTRGGFRRLIAWIGSHEPHVLAMFVVLSGATWGFAELSDAVQEGHTAPIDERLLLALRVADDPTNPIGPAWLEETARDITGLGGIAILALLSLLAAGFLALQRKHHAAIYLLLATGGGMLASTLLKALFDRPRPDLVPHAQVVYTSSFPSSHSMMSAVTFLTIGALLASAQAGLRLKAYLLGVALLLTVLVGCTRVYLGVHWPTDVLAGWTAGAAWALLCWMIAERLRARGDVE